MCFQWCVVGRGLVVSYHLIENTFTNTNRGCGGWRGRETHVWRQSCVHPGSSTPRHFTTLHRNTWFHSEKYWTSIKEITSWAIHTMPLCHTTYQARLDFIQRYIDYFTTQLHYTASSKCGSPKAGPFCLQHHLQEDSERTEPSPWPRTLIYMRWLNEMKKQNERKHWNARRLSIPVYSAIFKDIPQSSGNMAIFIATRSCAALRASDRDFQIILLPNIMFYPFITTLDGGGGAGQE